MAKFNLVLALAAVALAFTFTASNSVADDNSWIELKSPGTGSNSIGIPFYNEEVHDGKALGSGLPVNILVQFIASTENMTVSMFYDLNPEWEDVGDQTLDSGDLVGYFTSPRSALIASN